MIFSGLNNFKVAEIIFYKMIYFANVLFSSHFIFTVSLKYEYGKGLYQVNFGLKLKQARTNKDLSLFGLAKITECPNRI
jgi:hypothetical protein